MQQKQNRGDERAGVADADPPDEIHDRETPCDRNVDSPDADSFQQQPGDGEVQHHQKRKGDRESAEPAAMHRPLEDDVADLSRDRRVVVTRRDDWLFESPAHALLQLRVGIAQLRQIGRPRPRIQFRRASHNSAASTAQLLPPGCSRIIEIAEDDRVGRTSLRAGGRDFAVANRRDSLSPRRFSPR